MHSRHTALTISVSLAQISEFAFILAGLGISLNLLSSEGRNLMLAAAILSIMLNPILFSLLERFLTKSESHQEQAQEKAIEEEKRIPVDMCRHAVIVGCGHGGSLLGQKLLEADVPFVVVENSRARQARRMLVQHLTADEVGVLAHLRR